MKCYLQRVWALSDSLVGQDDSSIQISCWTTVANEIYQFFGSKRPLCASAFLSWLLWDSFCFVRVPASLGPSPLLCFFVLYCPGFSGTAFSSFRVPASLGPSPTLVRFCFSVPASLGQFFAGPGLSGSLPLFSRCMVWVILMHRLTAWP